MKTRTLGTKATGGGARYALEPLDCFQAATFRSSVELIGHIVLDRPHCQDAAKADRTAARESTKLDWMRRLRLAKFLVSHSELEWLYQAQDVPEKCVVCGDSDWAGSDSRRSTTGARLNSLDSIPLNSAAQLSTSSLSQVLRQRAACYGTCGSRVAVNSAVGRGWSGAGAGSVHGQYGEHRYAQPYGIRASTAPGCEVALD